MGLSAITVGVVPMIDEWISAPVSAAASLIAR